MSKQIQKNDTDATAIPVTAGMLLAERLGAWLLTALALLVSLEMLLQHNPWTPINHTSGSYGGGQPSSELFARGEGRGEAARLPEEFDIGLQTPHVTGL